jgi:hypothetical protein
MITQRLVCVAILWSGMHTCCCINNVVTETMLCLTVGTTQPFTLYIWLVALVPLCLSAQVQGFIPVLVLVVGREFALWYFWDLAWGPHLSW